MSVPIDGEDNPMKPTPVTDGSFDSLVLGASEPVLVDFWADT